MYYTVSEMSKKVNLSPHTLRFYAKEGLLPFVERSKNAIRLFKDDDFDSLNMIECLKKSGMSIKEIKRFSMFINNTAHKATCFMGLIAFQRYSINLVSAN